jgi:hypothetical protein
MASPVKPNADTLIFVDVDGVLNVGVRDPGHSPLEFTTTNAQCALDKWGKHHDCKQRLTIERLVSAHQRELGHGEQGTYAKYLSHPQFGYSDVFLARLARIIRAAGEHASFVLSSTWRLPKHQSRVKKLEAAISEHLGKVFTFDARTELFLDLTPQDRLRAIRKYVTEYATRHSGMIDQLKVLVLEDFHTTPLGGMGPCDYCEMDSTESIERYLRESVELACTHVKPEVRLVHTYDEWTTPEGLLVQLGCGLTMENFYKAINFLGGCCEICTGQRQQSAEDIVVEEFVYANTGVCAKEFTDILTSVRRYFGK